MKRMSSPDLVRLTNDARRAACLRQWRICSRARVHNRHRFGNRVCVISDDLCRHGYHKQLIDADGLIRYLRCAGDHRRRPIVLRTFRRGAIMRQPPLDSCFAFLMGCATARKKRPSKTRAAWIIHRLAMTLEADALDEVHMPQQGAPHTPDEFYAMIKRVIERSVRKIRKEDSS